MEISSSACPECGAEVSVRALVGPITAGFVDSPNEPMAVVSEMELATCRKCGAFLRRVKSEPALIWELTGL
jgi:ribosomal protein L40E